MLEWLARGLRGRRITTAYPRTPEHPAAGFQGQITVLDGGSAEIELEAICPTRAIRVDASGQVGLDRGRCILCGACVRSAPERFAFGRRFESAARERQALVVTSSNRDQALCGSGGALTGARQVALGDIAGGLRRSIHVRHVDAGSDGAEEWEIRALWNPFYDIQRLGFFLTAAPRHADILLVTGGVTAPLREPLQLAYELMPEPRAVIAVGTDACSGGLAGESHPAQPTAGGVDQLIPVDVYVPGSPPAPIAIIDGLLLAVGLLRASAADSSQPIGGPR